MRYWSAQIETASGLKGAFGRATPIRSSRRRTWREVGESAADTNKGRNPRHVKFKFQAWGKKDRREILHDIADSDIAVSRPCDRELQVYAGNVSVKDTMGKDTF